MDKKKRKTPESTFSLFERLSLFDTKSKKSHCPHLEMKKFEKQEVESYISVEDAFYDSKTDSEIASIIHGLSI